MTSSAVPSHLVLLATLAACASGAPPPEQAHTGGAARGSAAANAPAASAQHASSAQAQRGAPPVEPSAATTSVSEPAPAESGEGRADLLRGHIAHQYQARLLSFFRKGFVAKGLSLPASDIARLTAEATCRLDAVGTVVACVVSQPSGHPGFDAATLEWLERRKGQVAPPPPEAMPELRPPIVTISMRCGQGCD